MRQQWVEPVIFFKFLQRLFDVFLALENTIAVVVGCRIVGFEFDAALESLERFVKIAGVVVDGTKPEVVVEVFKLVDIAGFYQSRKVAGVTEMPEQFDKCNIAFG